MKKILWSLLTILMLISFQSCQKDLTSFDYDFVVEFSDHSIIINSEKSLNNFIRLVMNTPDIQIIESSFGESEDIHGKYHLIQARYQIKDKTTSLVIPLERINIEGQEETTLSFSTSGGCTMTCTPSSLCTGCTQTINERCKSQTCSCVSGTGCTGSIKFDSREE